jgi:hypothetical protein
MTPIMFNDVTYSTGRTYDTDTVSNRRFEGVVDVNELRRVGWRKKRKWAEKAKVEP